MANSEKLIFDKFDVVIDPELLRFSEQSLSDYIQKESGYYDYYGSFLALAERNLQNKEILHEKTYCERFDEAKESGCTEKQSEAKGKADPVVHKLKQDIVDAKYIVNRLKQHLRAWDKNHDNAQSMGHMLRKQMDKLNADIMAKHYDGGGNQITGLDDAVQETVTSDSNEFESNLSSENLLY